MSKRQFPVADRATVRRVVGELLGAERRQLAAVVGLYALASAAGLAGPLLLGELVDRVQAGATVSVIDVLAAVLVGCILVELIVTRYARYAGHRLGERMLTRLRERFVDRVLRIPISIVERAGTGDLMTRNSSDMANMSAMVRDAAPELIVSAVQLSVILVALIYLHPALTACLLLLAPSAWLGSRWYLRRAREAYLAEGAADSDLSETLAATAEGARTMEAHRLQRRRRHAGDETIAAAYRSRRRTLFLRCVFFPCLDAVYWVPIAGVAMLGGLLYFNDAVSLGVVVAASLLCRRFVEPLDRMFMWLEQLQRGTASLARVEGVGLVDDDRGRSTAVPRDDHIAVHGVRYAYRDDHDVLHDVDLTVQPGERLAVVGPSGAGKSTLGRLLAGIDAPRRGSVTLGGVDVTALPPEELRSRVALVTQDHHVFVGSLRENLALADASADDTQLNAALEAVDSDWVRQLPQGLDTQLGADDVTLNAAQSQQLALARIVLANPHTVILDEATSMLDPSAARDAERSLAAVLDGRTVVAVAHRLHTAEAADRVAVVDSGRIVELGSHRQLLAAGGSYASLWHTWHGD